MKPPKIVEEENPDMSALTLPKGICDGHIYDSYRGRINDPHWQSSSCRNWKPIGEPGKER